MAGLLSRPVESDVSGALKGDAGKSPAAAVTVAFVPDFNPVGNDVRVQFTFRARAG